MDPRIVQAIKNRRRLSFVYGGHARTVEPHSYGLSKTGDEILLGYQISGGHASGHHQPWHLFHVSKISSMSETDGFNGPRRDFKRDDNKIHSIIVEL